jgi:hypothetical protein
MVSYFRARFYTAMKIFDRICQVNFLRDEIGYVCLIRSEPI